MAWTHLTGKLRPRRPSAGLVVAFIALFVALSGTSLGHSTVSAAKHLITGAQIQDGSLTSADVRNGTLRAKDFHAGQLKAGPRGRRGPQGPKGDTGTVDTSAFYSKSESDARFVAKGDAR